MSPRMTHICLHVKELNVCIQFYRKFCSMDVIHERTNGGEGSVYMSEVGRQTEIVFQFMSGGENLALADDDNRHFGFAVESKQAVDDIANRAREDGILFWEPDEYIPGAYICAVKDPNGNCVEFSYGHPMPPV
ncbi:MAG: VOC family protein [Proteobacteria bacterium]|nr:MAG: VOC family protein [Pseudomonadota bacterium]